MNLQTKIPLHPQTDNQIDYDSKVLSFGSCFAEHIGNKLNYYKFQNTTNPFGILFHPIAIERCIINSIQQKKYNPFDLVFHQERYHCFDVHSDLSDANESKCLENLNSAINATHENLKNTSHVIITLGTAWVYRHLDSNQYVANCHKIPQREFKKELLSIEKIQLTLQSIVSKIQQLNPKAQLIFTVSPVRHLKDGFVENTLSKAHLISAAHQVVAQQENCHSFPSYEIMMDELRDYRFYKDDMVHPSNLAIDYIWNKFKSVWIASEAEKTMETVEDIQKALQHQPFNPNSSSHKAFLEHISHKKESLIKSFAHISF